MGSLFAGIGGFDLGFERAGFKTVWQVEIDEYCRRVLARNFPNAKRYADVKECGRHNLESVFALCAGFPCQDISYAGPGGGLSGERSGLFFHAARIIGELEPAVVVLENVAALLDRGMGVVLGTLSDLRFDVEWSTVSACSMGATHVRQRVFLVAYSNRFNGWPRVWYSDAQQVGTLQTVNGFESARTRQKERLANPSALYRGADGVPAGMDRNRGIGNAVYPDVAEWIAYRIKERLSA